MEIRARLAAENDAEELARLNQLFNGGDRRPSPEIIESMRTSSELIAVAECDGKIVGFGCAQSFQSFCYGELLGEITEIYVEESARGKGAAALLISCLEKHLKQRGVAEMKVLTDSQNAVAIRTYERCGYVVDDEVLLKKQLGVEPTDTRALP
ncbi:GNAT family N-acetyltransferase [Brevibacillus borstelensis]|uniref:GNAT family N-acetyltransferase n=1 Tax=Brevibacillus borstelensis TaxID=45462 RepID=UPI0030BFD7A9